MITPGIPERDLGRRAFLTAALAAPVVASRLPTSAAQSPPLPIVPRSEWGGDLAPRGPIPAEDVKFLIVHHTLEPNSDYAAAEVPKLLRGIQSFHTGASKGWPDIAYNFFVDKYGTVYEGRTGSLAGPVQGSATGGNQGFTQLCCFLGDYSAQVPPAPALQSMYRLLAWLADRYDVDTSDGATVEFTSRGSNKWPAGTKVTTATIAAHREMSQTECPGDACFGLVKSVFPAQVSSLRSSAPGSAPPPTTAAAAAPTDPPTTAPPTTVAEPAPTTLTPTTVPAPTTGVSTTTVGGVTESASGVTVGSDDGSIWPLAVGGGAVAVGLTAAAAAAARRSRLPLAIDVDTAAAGATRLRCLVLPAGDVVWHADGEWSRSGLATLHDRISGLATERITAPGWTDRPAALLADFARIVEAEAPAGDTWGVWLVGRDGDDAVMLLLGDADGSLVDTSGDSARLPDGASSASLDGARLMLRSARSAPSFAVARDTVDAAPDAQEAR